MPRYQACMGPSANRAHIRDLHSDERLVLCESTAWVRSIKSAVTSASICQKCLRVMFSRMGFAFDVKTQVYKNDAGEFACLTADGIGVAEIVP